MAYAYNFQYPQILSDLTRLINAFYGDEVVDGILDGIRDDLYGPQIDLRKDLFPQFQGELFLIVDKHSGRLDDAITIVLPVKDADKTWQLVSQAHRFEPNSPTENYRDTTLLVFPAQESSRKALCIAEDNLIVGELTDVQAAIDRLIGK